MEGSLWQPATIPDFILMVLVIIAVFLTLVGVLGVVWTAFRAVLSARQPSDITVMRRVEGQAFIRYQNQEWANDLFRAYTDGAEMALREKRTGKR